MTCKYPYDVGDSHVVSRALWLALHDEQGRPLRFPGDNGCAPRFNPRWSDWLESVQATYAKR